MTSEADMTGRTNSPLLTDSGSRSCMHTSEESVFVGEVEGPEVHDGRHRRRLPDGEHGRALGDGQLLQDDPLDQRPHRDGAAVSRDASTYM